MYSEQLKIGMTLYCDDGYSTVELCSVQNDTIIVSFSASKNNSQSAQAFARKP